MLKQYQIDRLTTVTSATRARQPVQPGLVEEDHRFGATCLGQGLFQGKQTAVGYVPEQHTDFIFTAVGEELGFCGCRDPARPLRGGDVAHLANSRLTAPRLLRHPRVCRDLAMFGFQIFENVG